jgi:alpha-L-fucosidase 2
MKELKLWYKQPAETWNQALPVGNGRIGAMIYGGDPDDDMKWMGDPSMFLPYDEEIEFELVKGARFQLNEDTLWSGYPRDFTNPDAAKHLEQARKLIFDGKYAEAKALVEEKMQGQYMEAYQPLGHVCISYEYEQTNKKTPIVQDYHRELDLNEAIVRCSYTINNNSYTRESFCSAPDDVLVIHLTAQNSKELSFSVDLKTPHDIFSITYKKNSVLATGHAPSAIEAYGPSDPDYSESEAKSLKFAFKLLVTNTDGEIVSTDNTLKVHKATHATLLLAAATSFISFDHPKGNFAKDPVLIVDNTIKSASSHNFDALKTRHLNDYKPLFERVTLDLGTSPSADLPTDERITKIWLSEQDSIPKIVDFDPKSHSYDPTVEDAILDGWDDPDLIALHFQYCRYLLIASSRQGTQPANLQGIWNFQRKPSWASNYTLNQNLQFNYLSMEEANLSELGDPFWQLCEDLAKSGKKTAQVNYGCSGWVAHHNTTLWRETTPTAGAALWAYWPVGGAWTARHMWEHYAFEPSEEKRAWLQSVAYPIFKGAAEFFLDFLVELPEKTQKSVAKFGGIVEGGPYLVTAPSTSPENAFVYLDEKGVKVQSNVCYGSACDMAIIWDLFTIVLKCARIIGISGEFIDRIENAREKLLPYSISERYVHSLQEWPADFEKGGHGFRLEAYMYPWWPGSQFSKHTHPKWAQILKGNVDSNLSFRSQGNGWGPSWMINILARLEDGELAYRMVVQNMRRARHLNLFGRFMGSATQLDCNWGDSSGICEMLLQSHENEHMDDPTVPAIINLLPALPKAWAKGSYVGLRARGGFIVDVEWDNGNLVRAKLMSVCGNLIQIRSKVPLTVKTEFETSVTKSGDSCIEFPTIKGGSYELFPI